MSLEHRTDPSPCPICGEVPEVDYGLADAPHEIPHISCPTVFISGPLTVACPVYAQGFDAWEHLVKSAQFHAKRGDLMTYKLVHGRSLKALEGAVNELIALGFKPLGGPYAVQEKRAGEMTVRYLHIQAMTIKT